MLVERHFNALYAFLRSRALGPVEDLMQQTLLACVEGRARFRGESSFRTYLLQIARYQLYADYRRATHCGAYDFDEIAARESSVCSRLVRKQDERLLLRALRRLPPMFQVVLKLSFFDDLSGPEIAAALQIPEATVRSRLRRGLDHVRAQVRELSSDADSLRETASELESWAARIEAASSLQASA
jgi:RNA polymerase sigma-70 factor (ECF subfamily)